MVHFNETQDERGICLIFGLYVKMSELIKVTFLIFGLYVKILTWICLKGGAF